MYVHCGSGMFVVRKQNLHYTYTIVLIKLLCLDILIMKHFHNRQANTPTIVQVRSRPSKALVLVNTPHAVQISIITDACSVNDR